MRKVVLNLGVMGIALALTGCGTTNRVGDLFTPYQSNSYSARMTLAQSVQDALLQNGDPVLAQVRVEANQNVVYLTGYVKKIRQSDTAEQIARQVPGVQQVENRLIVRQ